MLVFDFHSAVPLKKSCPHSDRNNGMRDVFTKYLTSNTFRGFGGVCSNTSPILIPLTIDWKHSWNERYQAIRDQIRHRAQQSVQLETL